MVLGGTLAPESIGDELSESVIGILVRRQPNKYISLKMTHGLICVSHV